jgi:hypothetical protein
MKNIATLSVIKLLFFFLIRKGKETSLPTGALLEIETLHYLSRILEDVWGKRRHRKGEKHIKIHSL